MKILDELEKSFLKMLRKVSMEERHKNSAAEIQAAKILVSIENMKRLAGSKSNNKK